MGRKKKKPSRDDGSKEVFTTSETTVPFIVVSLYPTRHQKTKSRAKPAVYLTFADAQQLGLAKNETVFVVAGKKQNSRALLLHHEVVGVAPSSGGSTPRRHQQLSLAARSAQIMPSSLIDMMIPEQPSKSKDVAETSSPPMVHLSTPTKGFSFQNQVSADSNRTPTPSNSLSKEKRIEATIVGSNSLIGQALTQTLCRWCSRLVLQYRSDDLVARDFPFVERLFIAHCAGQFVQQHQQMTISYTGKPIDLVVVETEAVDDHDSQQTIQLDDTDISLLLNGGDQSSSEDSSSCLDVLRTCQGSLYEITHETKITFSSPLQDTEPSEESKEQQQRVVGLDPIVNEVITLLETPLYRSDWLREQGLSVPRGVLIYGSGGTGKTTLAKQVASSLKCSTEYVPCAKILAQAAIVGQAERSLSRLFRASTHRKVVILDDVHLICSRRGGYSTHDRLAATLLALMDGVVETKVVVLAITSDPSLLDQALRRSGRLDNEIEIPPPDGPLQRAAILQFHAESLGVGGSFVEWEELGKLAKGFNGSDCMLAVKSAARSSHLACRDAICQQDLEQAIRSIKPSAIKSISVEVPKVLWTSIGGMDSVKKQLREAINMSESDLEGFHGSLPPCSGILLYGPPGCSKTLMARALATEGSMNFLAVKGPELLSKWLGESERTLASLFRRARMASPSIIFFDEIDSIATKRGTSDSASSTRLLSQLLTELDGVKTSSQRVVVVAATNRPDLLDHALVRFGRIDRKIYVGLPDESSRLQILELQLEGKPCSDDMDLAFLASATQGCSGAEVVAVCRDAGLYAAEMDGPQRITMDHMRLAVENLQRQVSPEMLEFYKAYRDEN